MPTIAIVHMGLTGHVVPATRLGAVLARRGDRVLAWAPERYRELIESADTEFRPHEPAPFRWFEGGLPGFAALLTDGTRREVGNLIEQLLAERVDLVVHDCHALWGRVAADFLGLPRIVSNPLFPARALEATEGQINTMFPPGWTESVDRVASNRDAIAREWDVDVGGWYDAMLSSGGTTVSYTTEAVIGPARLKPGWQPVGPLMDSRPSEDLCGRPLVYVALGTFSNFRRDVYRTAIEALADHDVGGIVSTGGGLISPSDLAPLPPNVEAFEFVDSRAVLARAAAHVTHGGGGSVHESLLAGVPMVCIPQAVDQYLWAERVEHLGAGETVELSSEAIRAAIQRLLADDRARAGARAAGQALAEYDGAGRVAELVDQALATDVGGERRLAS